MDFSAAGFDGKDRELVTGSQNLRNIRGILALPIRGSSDCEDAQCGKKACGVPHLKVIATEQLAEESLDSANQTGSRNSC